MTQPTKNNLPDRNDASLLQQTKHQCTIVTSTTILSALLSPPPQRTDNNNKPPITNEKSHTIHPSDQAKRNISLPSQPISNATKTRHSPLSYVPKAKTFQT